MIDQNERNRLLIEEFRASQGQTAGPGGAPLLLLTVIGRKSGLPRTTPLVYLADGERFVIFASHQGAPTSPDWFHNLMARPTATIEVGAEHFEVRPVLAAKEERDRLYARQGQLHPRFAEYQEKTTRQIPVVCLVRVA